MSNSKVKTQMSKVIQYVSFTIWAERLGEHQEN